jgi:hypothetical protein
MPLQSKERTLYRDIIHGAWEVTWHRRQLWVLGLFAALLGGGALDTITHGANAIASGEPFVETFIFMQNSRLALTAGGTNEKLTVVLAALLFAALAVLMLMLAISGAAGLTAATARIVRGKTVSLREAFVAGIRNFWPVLWLQVIGRAVLTTLLLLTAGFSYLAAYSNGTGTLTYLLLFVLFACTALGVSFITSIATAAIVIKEHDLLSAFAAAWRLLIRHWLISIEMVIVLFTAALAASIGLALGAAVLSIPFFLLILAAAVLKSAVMLTLVAVVGGIVLVALVAIGGSVFTTFTYAAWTLLYLRIAERSAVAKITRVGRALKLHRRIA